MSRDLFAELCAHYKDTKPDRRGWRHVECPGCGHEPSEKQPAFSFKEFGGKCFSCNQKFSLKDMAQKAGLWDNTPGHRHLPTMTPVKRPAAPPVKPQATWKANAKKLVEGYCNHPKNLEMWASYKPVSEEVIRKHHFGFGPLPGQSTPRLIVPLYLNGEIVGLKGRVLPGTETDAKWICATDSNVSVLWGIEHVPYRPQTLWICENYVDAAIVTQVTGIPAVSGGGARMLTKDEIAAIKKVNPQFVVVAYDNDLVGSASPKMRERLEREWIENWKKRHPEKTNAPKPPPSVAFPLAEALKREGLLASTFPWEDDAPHKADVMWALSQQV